MDSEATRLSVLLVEDNPGDARFIRELVAESGAAPACLAQVDRLSTALERLHEPDLDVVLLDLGLPDSQGLATLTKVREAVPGLPIVVLSGQTDTTLAVRAVREGAQDYLLKGHVDPEILQRALRYAVEHKRIEQRQQFLSQAGRALADNLEYEATVQCAVRLPVPFLADACLVTLAAHDSPAPRLVVHDVDPARQPRLQQVSSGSAMPASAPQPLTGLPPALAGLGFAACLIVPLAAHERTLGNLCLLRSAVRPAFSREEVQLAEELALRTALALENARLHHELQLAVSLRDEVLAATSHDLRSPLTGITLQGALLRRVLRSDPAGPGADVRARVVQGLDLIDAAIGRSLGLIQELLDAVSLQAGRELQLDRRQTDLVALARRVVAEHQARTVRHTLGLQVAGGPLVGHWDPQRLMRVLDNLIGNAIKYSPLGPISVVLGRDIGAEGVWAVIQVRDHGVGIPTGELERVFDRFYRGTNVAGEQRGVGIGLAGVRQIVENHGGSVGVQSEEGVGSTFTVRLPLCSAA